MTENEEFKQALVNQNIKAYSSQRKNFTVEADLIMEKVARGEELSQIEVFTLICDEPIKLEQYKKYHDLKEKVLNGNLNNEDLQFMARELNGNDSTLEKILLSALIDKNNHFINKEEKPVSDKKIL